ncbi:unnamed protein product [Amaranthus hypochondriacus]
MKEKKTTSILQHILAKCITQATLESDSLSASLLVLKWSLQLIVQALDLKPNYLCAWANMGICYANQGMYEESIRYYVRALTMNPKADNACCASRDDMLEACDSRNLDVLKKEFPL